MIQFQEEEKETKIVPHEFKSSFERLRDRLTAEKENLHLRLGECRVENLILLRLAEFDSLKQMDDLFGKDRFLRAFANRIRENPVTLGLLISKDELVLLHRQAHLVGMSLKPFYEAAVVRVCSGNYKSPEREISY